MDNEINDVSSEKIPIVDFSCASLDVEDDNISESDLQRVAAEVMKAFTTVGFAYLTNTGLPKQDIDHVFSESLKFFQLSESIKKQYKGSPDTTDAIGWKEMFQEQVNPNIIDKKETFDIAPSKFSDPDIWPKEVPSFKQSIRKLYTLSGRLADRVMLAIAVGLKLPDRHFFEKCHSFDPDLNHERGLTFMRSLYYPPIVQSSTDVEDRNRLGEHSDYGTITLLFQDHIGGLQVRGKNNQWIDAKPIPDTVIVNVADFLQRWTSDVLVSTRHRVLLPGPESLDRDKTRQSIAFFVHPDKGSVISCLDGSNKYQPVESKEYLLQRLADTYKSS